MDRLKKSRAPLRSEVTKLIGKLTQDLASENPDRDLIQARWERLAQNFTKLSECDEQIRTQMLDDDCSAEDLEAEVTTISEYEEKYDLIKVKVDRFMNPIPSPPGSSSSPSVISEFNTAYETRMKKNYKLPKIEFRKFSGDIKEWLGFWAQFSKLHEDADIDDADKFQYLAQCIVKGSPADKIMECYPQSGPNYPKAIAALKEHFGNTRVLMDVYIRELIKLSTSLTDKTPLSTVYYKLESHLKSLESLGVTSDKWSYWLLPLIESGLPEDVMRAWQRSALYKDIGSEAKDDNLLDNMMKFLKQEVMCEERISRAKAGTSAAASKPVKKKEQSRQIDDLVATAAGLQISEKNASCLFCDGGHESQSCGKALSLSLEDRKAKVQKSRNCFLCLRKGHGAKACKVFVKCLLCEKKHHALLCPSLSDCKKLASSPKAESSKAPVNVSMVSQSATCEVLLQTLIVNVTVAGRKVKARMLLDSGSQRSYVRSEVVAQLGLEPVGSEWLSQTVFGGATSAAILHRKYRLTISDVRGHNYRQLEALDQSVICGRIPRIRKGPWLKELAVNDIWLSDVGDDAPDITILIGADNYRSVLTGRVVELESGLTAVESVWGWTVMGRVASDKCSSSLVAQVISMTISSYSVQDLWRLETIGIQDPAEHKSKQEREAAALEHFKRTVKVDNEGRYEVSLPWVADRQEIPSNEEVAKKRLISCTRKLQVNGYMREYGQVFQEWLRDGIIEEVPKEKLVAPCHYLPHRPVFKESKTTPVRPVFDASCKVGRAPSLNDCLEKGPSMLELIPSILCRFREKKFGVIADIKRAFLTIAVAKDDRDYLRFLWWEGDDAKTTTVYRHKRVVFGVNCSPFLLAAVIEHHLTAVPEEKKELATKLLRSLYVDNCVASVDSTEELLEFKEKATALLASAKMDLRMWEHSSTGDVSGVGSLISRECGLDTGSADQGEATITSVLGLKWDKASDTLFVEKKDFQPPVAVTKRKILSVTHSVYDPLGFLAPTLLQAKLLLKDAWGLDLGWDDELPESIRNSFIEWLSGSGFLFDIRVPRWIAEATGDRAKWSLHTFCDASKLAYAAVVFLRCEEEGKVSVQMIQCKSRVSPSEKVSICRLELLACTIGSRLADSVKTALDLRDVSCQYWSDSTTAIAWIKRNDDWGTFVGNRVKEIVKLTSPDQWSHVPGPMNPADLPSRGCSAKALLQSRWWEGPAWLRRPPEEWPKEEVAVDEQAVAAEKKKRATALVTNEKSVPWYAVRFSKYSTILRLIAWVKRFVQNSRKKSGRLTGNLTAEEISEAELTLVRIIQKESFEDSKIPGDLHVSTDDHGLIRVETKITRLNDDYSFRHPLVLPSKHLIVEALVREEHLKSSHAGVQATMNKLRERFWIVKCRQVVRNVIRTCVRCRRYDAKPPMVDPCPLPLDRVKMTAPFQVTGIDLAGPLYLKDDTKCWIVLFTCAVYRAVHLELVLSLDTESFLQSFRRFIARRGRILVTWTDNGTNFAGSENLFRALDWKKIQDNFAVQRIKWVFNPPGGPWWGGWWERLIRMMKGLLLRTLGRSRLNYVELETILCDVEAVMNDRPLTYVSEDVDDLVPLTPAMFLHELGSSSVPDVDELDREGFQRRYRYRQKLLDELRSRFRKEYLSQLVQRKNEKARYEIKVGDVVIIGADNKKKLLWPMARVIELIPGKDGKVRVARLKTKKGEFVRPLQRLHPLEVDEKGRYQIPELSQGGSPKKDQVVEKKTTKKSKMVTESPEEEKPTVVTRSGRKVVTPIRPDL